MGCGCIYLGCVVVCIGGVGMCIYVWVVVSSKLHVWLRLGYEEARVWGVLAV